MDNFNGISPFKNNRTSLGHKRYAYELFYAKNIPGFRQEGIQAIEPCTIELSLVFLPMTSVDDTAVLFLLRG